MNILNPATLDRTFMLAMFRQTRGERREKLRIRKIKPDADRLKEKIALWVKGHKECIASAYDKSNFPYLEEFSDRTVDIAQPLAADIEIAYADSPKLKIARMKLQQAISLARNEQQSDTDGHKAIRRLLAVIKLTEKDPLVGNPTELSEITERSVKETVSPTMISSTLRQYGFKTKNCRLGGGDPKYRYVLPKAELAEILERYGAPDPREPEIEDDTIPVEVIGGDDAAIKDVVSVVSKTEGIAATRIEAENDED
jgi:hypothetical protein